MSPADDAQHSVPLKIDTTVPHSARFWNYWLGGEDWYPVDKELGDALREQYPSIAGIAVASREFLGRAVRHLARDVGIRQFLDIGSGLPTAENTHQVAQRYAPDSRIVYADTDPTVLMHSQALLTSTPEGRTAYLDADVRDVDVMLERAGTELDLDRPVALMLLSMLGHIEPDPAAELVQEYTRRLPPPPPPPPPPPTPRSSPSARTTPPPGPPRTTRAPGTSWRPPPRASNSCRPASARSRGGAPTTRRSNPRRTSCSSGAWWPGNPEPRRARNAVSALTVGECASFPSFPPRRRSCSRSAPVTPWWA